jgi:DNA polymerase
MDNTTRLQYLEAMGIESWQLRYTPPAISDLTGFQNLSGLDAPNETPKPAAPVEIPETPVIAPPIAPEVIQPVMIPVDNWDTLQQEVANCRQCALCQTRTQTVFGSGNKNPDWLFIGEAPGEQEDLQGQPFVGAAGALLTEMLRAIGLKREDIFIANILKCRPPGNRDPHVDEMNACRPFLNRQIALIQPKIIVAVGRIAAQQLLNTDIAIGKLRGKVYEVNNTPLCVFYHPAYLLRSLSQKAKAWQDLQLALKTYQEIKERK